MSGPFNQISGIGVRTMHPKVFLPIFGTFEIDTTKMSKNTSISLGDYFDQFVQSSIKEGRKEGLRM